MILLVSHGNFENMVKWSTNNIGTFKTDEKNTIAAHPNMVMSEEQKVDKTPLRNSISTFSTLEKCVMSKQVYCLNTMIKITVGFPYTAPSSPKSRPNISSPFHLFLPISQRSETAWPSRAVSCECHTDRVLPPSPTLPERKPIADITGPYRALRDTFPHFLTMTWLGLRWLGDVEAVTVPGQMERQLRGRFERQKKKGLKNSDTKSPQEVDVGWERLREKKHEQSC